MKLHCGAGMHVLSGWVSIDIDPACSPDLVHDLGKPMPLPDGCAEFVHTEDFLCCLPSLSAVRTFLSEVHRVLRPGGTMRLLLPSLERLLEGYFSRPARLLELWHRDVGLPLEPDTAGMLVNRALKGLPFFFDRPTLFALLHEAGFAVRECDYNCSPHPALRGLDLRRPDESVSMYLECDRR